MKNIKGYMLRTLCWMLVLLIMASTLMACGKTSSAPDGYQYATCAGEYFRLFVPDGWSVNTKSGVSGAYLNAATHVTMEEVWFAYEKVEPDSARDTESVSESVTESETAADDPMAVLSAHLRAFVQYHTAEIAGLQEYKSLKGMVSTLGGLPAWDMTYEAKVGVTTYRFRQVLTSAKVADTQRFFVFTYTAPADDSFDLWLDQVEGIMDEVTFETFPYEGDHERNIPADANTPEGMQRVSTDEVIYRFYAPESWIVDADNDQCLVYASETDRSNVSVMSYLPSGTVAMSVEDYWKQCKLEYENNAAFGKFAVVGESNEEKLGGGQSLCCEFTYIMGGGDYKCRQIMAAYRGMIYVMTYTAKAELYDLHMDEVRLMQTEIVFK